MTNDQSNQTPIFTCTKFLGAFSNCSAITINKARNRVLQNEFDVFSTEVLGIKYDSNPNRRFTPWLCLLSSLSFSLLQESRVLCKYGNIQKWPLWVTLKWWIPVLHARKSESSEVNRGNLHYWCDVRTAKCYLRGLINLSAQSRNCQNWSKTLRIKYLVNKNLNWWKEKPSHYQQKCILPHFWICVLVLQLLLPWTKA